METYITFICIVVLCVAVYGLARMNIKNTVYPVACKVIYIPDKKSNIRENYLRRMKVNEFTKDQGDLHKYDYLSE